MGQRQSFALTEVSVAVGLRCYSNTDSEIIKLKLITAVSEKTTQTRKRKSSEGNGLKKVKGSHLCQRGNYGSGKKHLC